MDLHHVLFECFLGFFMFFCRFQLWSFGFLDLLKVLWFVGVCGCLVLELVFLWCVVGSCVFCFASMIFSDCSGESFWFFWFALGVIYCGFIFFSEL